MANEFVARKGLRSLSNVEITGSLNVSTTVTANGVTLTGDQDLSSFALSSNVVANSATSSFLTSSPFTAAGISGAFNNQTSSFITNSVTSSMSVATASFAIGLSEFNGNRTVSNQNFNSGIRNVNFGTSQSLSNFIEKVFFPNDAPVISFVITVSIGLVE